MLVSTKHACMEVVCGGWARSKGGHTTAAHCQQLRRADDQLRARAAGSQAHPLLAHHLCRRPVLQSTTEGFYEVPGLPTCTPALCAMGAGLHTINEYYHKSSASCMQAVFWHGMASFHVQRQMHAAMRQKMHVGSRVGCG